VPHKTREQWLAAASKLLDRHFFDANGYTLPKYRVSVGFARGSKKAIGQCWTNSVSKDGTHEIFICPTLGDKAERVLDVLLHELIHACVGIEHGHKKPFRKLVKEFGLEGKMTATYVTENTELWHKLCVLRDRLGEYPHAPMNPGDKKSLRLKKWFRFKSINEETYKCVIQMDRVEEFGAPVDPWGDQMELCEGQL
jgi:hypothetical protein